MSYEKHAITTDALDTLGSIIGPQEQRDAIHLAVFPTIAAHELKPGQHVSLDEMGLANRAEVNEGVGIVDPFLERTVWKGERFWLVVYPRQISSLRHVWEHPDFPATQETTSPDAILKAESKKWLEQWISQADCPGDFDAMVEACTTGSWHDGDYVSMRVDSDYFYVGGEDAGGEIPREFWDHMERYTGQRMAARPDYFTCSC